MAARARPSRRRSHQRGSSAATMCGAPVYQPITKSFVPEQPAPAADVMDAGLPALSMASSEESAPPAFSTAPSRKQQQLMAAAAARPVPQRLRFSKDFVPPPIKVRYVSTPAAAPDVMDAGSSAPSTPSDSSSSMERTPSPRGPLPSFSSSLAAPPLPFPTTAPMMPLPFSTTAPQPPRVEVRQVWAHNFEAEAKLIESLLPKFRYAAVDTEFPGTVYRPAGAAYTLTPERRYELLKLNVDALDLIQLGLTLFDSGGRLPSGLTTRYVWEFNFREFDVGRGRHAPESIAMLRAKGVDFAITRQHGVGAGAQFGPRLRKWLRAGLGRAGVVTFSGGYDLAYLVKAMFGPGFRMPATAAEFEGVAKAAMARRKLFDVKEMARLCPGVDLRGGLDAVAVKLGVGRTVGEAHQAGSDSLLTCHAFVKMREIYFDDDDDKLARVAGVLTDITAY